MRIGIDIGGTFTDFILFDEATGEIKAEKILSTPQDPARAVLEGMAILTPGPDVHVIHGSTVATNALLERKGSRTALITTKGFRDVLAIGRQVRTELYDFFADRPEPLVPNEWRLEVEERVDHHGHVLLPLREKQLPAMITFLHEQRVESVAICLLFSFLRPEHEATLARVFREAGFSVSPSYEILPEFREYERTSTTVINAYVAPALSRYLTELEGRLGIDRLFVMQSNGGMARAEEARREPVRSILSGPAGGAVGARYMAEKAGFGHLISFDMGGTSTDVSLCEGTIHVTTEGEIGGLPIRVPTVDIHTVGSGGGSIARVDAGGALRVGPESAGAAPGPVCYGRGGTQPTVTDANLVLGRLPADMFLGGRMPLDALAAQAALKRLASKAQITGREGLTSAQMAALGMIQVVNAHMERALRVISVERGHDPRDFVLVSFGGAGGLHATSLARSLGIPKVLVPIGASTLSAFGMLAADILKDYVQTVMLPGDTSFVELECLIEPMEERAIADLHRQGVPPERMTLHREIDMRYLGQGYELNLPLTPAFISAFHAAHERIYGHKAVEAPVEIVNLRLRAVGAVPHPWLPKLPVEGEDPSPALMDRRPVVLVGKGLTTVAFYRGEALRAGNALLGPAVVVYKDTTVFLEQGDCAKVDEYRNLVIEVGGEGGFVS
jgi:N-methylhydantoinase A